MEGCPPCHVRKRCAELGFAGSKANRPWQFVPLEYRDLRINIFGSLVSVTWLAGRLDADGHEKFADFFSPPVFEMRWAGRLFPEF